MWRLLYQPDVEDFAILERQANRTIFMMRSYDDRLSQEQVEKIELDTKQIATATAVYLLELRDKICCGSWWE